MNKVSLIIPTFNRPHLLPRAVESARRAAREVEIIVVDDASSDSTASVCAALPDIKYVRLDRNQGVAGARNVGLLESRGDFIAFLDDDDLRLPGSLDHQVFLLAAHAEAGFVAGGVMLADQDCVPTGEVAIHVQRAAIFFGKCWPWTCTSYLIRWSCEKNAFMKSGSLIAGSQASTIGTCGHASRRCVPCW